jgi:hypothetical protein
MNPPHPEPSLPRHHHVDLDPRHHHQIHIHLCHHHNPLAPAHQAPVFIPYAYPGAAPWQLDSPRSAVGEAAEDLNVEPALHAEEQAEEEDEEPVFVLTDEWAEFFAKSDAKRRLGS